MFTLFPDINFPREVESIIFLEATDSLATLKVYQQVSKGFKAAVDSPGFLHSLLAKFKGPSFSDSIYKCAPKKFLLIDRDMTIAFQTAVSKKEDCCAAMQKQDLKNTASVALKNLSTGMFSISGKPNYYFRIPKTLLEGLEKVDVMDQKAWQECIMSMVTCITTSNFPNQTQIIFADENPFLKLIESTFQSPNEKMQKLINEFEIQDIFFASSCDLIIHAHKIGLHIDHFQEAVLEPDHYKFLSTAQQLDSLIKQMRIIVRDGQLGYQVEMSKHHELCEKLNTFKLEDLKVIEENFSLEDQYLMGLIFPNFWPNIHKKFGETESVEITNRLLIRSFIKSIKMVDSEGQGNAQELYIDSSLRNFILNKLQDESTGLKKFIENNCKGYMLELFQNIIFREIWNDAPYDPTKPFSISKK